MSINIEPEKYFTLPIFGGFTVDETLAMSLLITFIVIIFAVLVRIFAIPRFTEKPGAFQNILEMTVSGMESMAENNLGTRLGSKLAPYVSTIGLYIVLGGILELFGFRTPASDINVTASLALMTFFLINYFAFREGLKKALSHYKPAVLAPIMLITDLAAPISLACRLYGNMLAGLVVMDLIYSVIPIGVPAVLALYFNIFHSFIQAYIFMTLTLSFIHERTE